MTHIFILVLFCASKIKSMRPRFLISSSPATKYGPPDKPVNISAKRLSDRAFLRVQDEGGGIPAEAHNRIFDSFERPASPNLAGLGLGLWITRKIVEAHGGKIWVQSEPGAGATFVVDLPVDGITA